MDSLSKMASLQLPEFKMPEIPSFSESYTKTVTEKIRAMEASLAPDRALIVYCDAAGERVRVMRLQFTGNSVIIVHGLDSDDNPTYFISTSFSLQLTCKMVKVQPDTKKTPIGFEFPEKHRASNET